MNSRIVSVVIALVAAFTLGWFFRGGKQQAPAAAGGAAEAQKPTVWTCSMHPQVRMNGPGSCPICSMPLVPAQSLGGDESATRLELSEQARAMASIETVPVARRKLMREMRATGKVQYNETAVATITSRVDGYVERLFVDYTGVPVSKGDHLVEMYSPDLVVAQDELLTAAGGQPNARLLDAARVKLLRLGITEPQIQQLLETRKVQERMTLYSPVRGTVIEKNVVEKSSVKAGDVLYRLVNLDSVWVNLDIYEFELIWIQHGQGVEISAEAYPGKTFKGMVTFVSPVLDEESRTIKVRVNVVNREQLLKPGMFVSAVVRVGLLSSGAPAPTAVAGKWTCPMHPEVIQDKKGACPVCEMPLEQIPGRPASAPETMDLYVCTAHPEATLDKPGICKQCGTMPLVEKTLPESEVYTCPMHPEVLRTEPGNCPKCGMKLERKGGESDQVLAVPITAVLDLGTRKLVYVERSKGQFEAVKIVAGPRAGDWVPILEGLKEGDRVVVRGNFLLDSQFQIQGRESLFNPGSHH